MCKISPNDFWDYTIQEVIDIIEAYAETKKAEMQFKAICSFNAAIEVVEGINNMFSKHPKQPQQLWEVYPYLFDKPVEKINKQKEDIMKARLLAYNEDWKKKHRKEVDK